MKKRLAWTFALTLGPVIAAAIFLGLGALSAETDHIILFMIGFLGMLFSLFAGVVCELASMALSAVMFFRRENRLLAILLFILSLLIALPFGYLALRIGTNLAFG